MSVDSRILAVAGGTGVIGRMVVDRARRAGWQPVVLARSAGVDLERGTGLDEALAGVDTVIDVVNVTTQSRRRAVEFFRASTANLLRAEERAGVGHHLTLSIVGIDRVDTGYYAGKLRQEEVVAGGAVELPPLGAAATAAARGALLPEGTGPRGTETFEQWLACTGGRPNPGMTEPAVGVVR